MSNCVAGRTYDANTWSCVLGLHSAHGKLLMKAFEVETNRLLRQHCIQGRLTGVLWPRQTRLEEEPICRCTVNRCIVTTT